MARAGVNYSNISQAAEYIQSEGMVPTVDRVRAHLGTGSKSTIAPLLKQWRELNADGDSEHALPKDLINSVKSLYERVQQLAQVKVEEIQRECNGVTDCLQQQLSDALARISQLGKGNAALETALEKSRTENLALKGSLQTSRSENEKTTFRLEEIKSRVSELKAANSELKQECKDIREHFEHYQQRTADERQHERDQFQAIQFRDQTLIENLTGQLRDSSSQLAHQAQVREQLDEKVDHLSEANQALNEQLMRKSAECTALHNQLTLETNGKRVLLEENEIFKTQITALSQEKIEAHRAQDLLTQSRDVISAELKEIKAKLFNVNNEHQIALQEKAVLQGQLKQIVNSTP